MSAMRLGGQPRTTYAKDDGAGGGNPDPTMKKGPGSPKGENMPPAGGETMEPADDSGRKTDERREAEEKR